MFSDNIRKEMFQDVDTARKAIDDVVRVLMSHNLTLNDCDLVLQATKDYIEFFTFINVNSIDSKEDNE